MINDLFKVLNYLNKHEHYNVYQASPRRFTCKYIHMPVKDYGAVYDTVIDLNTKQIIYRLREWSYSDTPAKQEYELDWQSNIEKIYKCLLDIMKNRVEYELDQEEKERERRFKESRILNKMNTILSEMPIEND